MSDDKENIEQEKKNKQGVWKKLLGLNSIYKLIDKFKILWQKIWGKDLPKDMTELFSNDKFEWQDQIDLYNKLKRKLTVKRFFVSATIVICSYVVLNFIFNNVVFAIKNNPTIACWNKPVCIYSGTKIKFDEKASRIIKTSFNEYIYVITELINYEKKQSKFVFRIYDTKRKKIIKKLINNSETFSYTRVIPISKNEILFFTDRVDNSGIVYIYHINENIFEQKKIDILKNCKFLSKSNRGIIFITNNSKAENRFRDYLKPNNILSQKESLFYLNFSNLQIEELPDFAKRPKFLPHEKDILILENGKIIIPIRINENSFFSPENNHSVWDHIELYLPKENKFIAITDTKPLENNLFNIKLQNGDILFINLNSTYIFKNDANKFISASAEETEKNKKLIYQLSSDLDYIIGERINNLLYNKHKFIKIDDDKYLITCGYGVNLKKDYLCNKTVYFDYGLSIVDEGPKFIYPHRDSLIIQDINNKNKYIVVGGAKFIPYEDSYKEIINENLQIIEKK